MVAGLKIKIPKKPYKLNGVLGSGERGRMENIRPTVTGLILHERIEVRNTRGRLTREYTERLISEAVLHGDRHKETMELAKWWLDSDKSAIHKLFKVLAPRFKDFTTSYTRLFNAPKTVDTEWSSNRAPQNYQDLVLVELKGHPYPPLAYSNTQPNKRAIHNVLLAEAAKEYRMSKASAAVDEVD